MAKDATKEHDGDKNYKYTVQNEDTQLTYLENRII